MTSLERASRQAVRAAFQGKRVECSPKEYREIRKCLVRAVHVLAGQGDDEHAELVMAQVLRLDLMHGVPEEAA